MTARKQLGERREIGEVPIWSAIKRRERRVGERSRETERAAGGSEQVRGHTELGEEVEPAEDEVSLTVSDLDLLRRLREHSVIELCLSERRGGRKAREPQGRVTPFGGGGF